jgi:hypothetical protein
LIADPQPGIENKDGKNFTCTSEKDVLLSLRLGI